MDQAELKQQIAGIGAAFEAWKSTFEEVQKTKGATLEATVDEKLRKIADDLSAKHETVTRELAAITSNIERPGKSVDPADEKVKADNAEKFAQHRKSFQEEKFKSLQRTYGSDYPDFEPSVDQYERYCKAFYRYLMCGSKGDLSLMSDEHRKDMSLGIDPDGGYFALPPTMASYVVSRIFETSPMWELADVANIDTKSLIIAEDPSDVGAGWVAERGSRSTSTTINPQAIEITAQEEYAEPALSQQLLEDRSVVNVEEYVGNKLSDKFRRLENTGFVSGTGVGQPKGFLSYGMTVVTTGTFGGFGTLEQINSGDSGNFTYSGFLRLVTSLKEPYQGNAKVLIRRQSIYNLLGITDNNGRLIFQPILNGNLNKQPLMGYELRYSTDMPDVAAGANAMAFGDFKAGYQIVNRVGMSVLRDPYTAKPFVLLYTRKRVGGGVKDFDAIKIHNLQ